MEIKLNIQNMKKIKLFENFPGSGMPDEYQKMTGDMSGDYKHMHVSSNKPNKQFALTTTSESSDHYIYFIEHPEMPTQEELEKFLIENGSDVDDGYCYESVDMCVEIKDFKKI